MAIRWCAWMRYTGFIKIRRGLREHLRSMSGNAVKLYCWLHLTANFGGPRKGCVESDYEEIASSLGWTKKTLQRTVAELNHRFSKVELAANQNEVTTIEIHKYDRQGSPSGVDAGVDASVD